MSLLTGLVAYFKLDENTGTTTTDSVASYVGSFSGSPSWVTGKINSGILPGASGNYVDFGASLQAAMPTSAISVSFWFAIPSTSGPSGCVATDLPSGAVHKGFSIFNYTDGNMYMDVGNNTTYARTSIAYTTGSVFQHFVMTYYGTTLQGYKNGTAVGTAAPIAGPIVYGSTNVSLGRLPSSSTGNTATIDEVGIWSRALTSAEITQLYNSGSGLQYPFSGGGSTTSLFRQPLLNGIGSGGPFFNNPIGRSMLGWRPKLVTA